MVGTLQNNKIVYSNPYSMCGYEMYGMMDIDTRKFINPLIYDVYNPRNLALVEGKKYEFEVIYFEDGQVAELFTQTEKE
jgi:hypothetical protein